MSLDSAERAGIDSGKVASRGPSENAKSAFEIVAARRVAVANAMADSVLLLMKVSLIHRDPVANVCPRIQRGQCERTIRINGRKVVPTKGGNTDRDPRLANMVSESLLLLMKVQPIYIARIVHPRRNSHDRPSSIKLDRQNPFPLSARPV